MGVIGEMAFYAKWVIFWLFFGLEVSWATESNPVLSTITIEGLLRERGTKKPLGMTNLYCFPTTIPLTTTPLNIPIKTTPLKTVTDRKGHFSIEIPRSEIPQGTFKWVASVSGYNRLELEDEQKSDQGNYPRELYLEKSSYLAYETTVYGQNEKRDDKTHSLDQSQFLTVPGANGDPVKAVQNLPGVNRAGPLSAQVIIEGSSPNDTRYNIDNQNVPIIFHFGGFSSVVIPEAVDHVDYLSAGFGPEFGQSTAGMVNLIVKDPQADRLHGFAYVDLINTGGMMEGPITDTSSFLVGLRQSYIGFALGAAVGNNPDFSLTAAPDFRDSIVEYRNQLTPIDTFKVVATGSQDTLAFLLPEPSNQDPSVRGNFSQETDFIRVIPELTHKYNSDVFGRFSLGLGKDWTYFNVGSIYTNTNATSVTGRAEIEDQLTSAWKNYWGIDTQLRSTNLSFQLPVSTSQGGVSNSLGSTNVRTVSNVYFTNATGLYWRNVIHPLDSQWTLTPGFRLSYYNFTNEVMPEPRVGAKYVLGSGWTLRGATGLYDEAPPVQDLDPTYGNPNLKSQRAIHGTIGFEKDFKQGAATGWIVTDDLFYKYLYSYVANTSAYSTPSQPLYYDNSGYGHIFGVELLAKYKGSKMEGWLAYTLSRSTLGTGQFAETLTSYDQTHLLTAVGSIELGQNWKFSSRVRYTTGDPYTPIIGGILDIDNDSYDPIPGGIYSARLGAFFQLDIRLDKKWIYDKWILSAYLDIENVTNQKNPLEVTYSYNYQQSAVISGLPILPTLGVKAEF